uniref:ethanolamine kinase n=1 Tax=Parastrongyloides trichosuri TaxID=131310 RepID=A0A0N4ZTS7_PARTI
MIIKKSFNIPTYPVELPLNDNKILETLSFALAEQLFPDWKHHTKNISYFTNGITNKIIGVSINNSSELSPSKLIFRIFGKNTENFIDRDTELNNFQILNSVGLAAPVYGKFKNGIIVGYLDGETLTINNVRDKIMSKKVASSMGKLHQLPIEEGNNNVKPMIIDKLNDYFHIMKTSFDNKHYQESFDNFFNNISIHDDYKKLVQYIQNDSCSLVFCHNDLLLGNILYDEKKDSIHFIDYEYAGVNYQLFDIANHFNEWAGIEEMDLSLLPTDEEKRYFVKNYLKTLSNSPVSDNEIDKIMKQLPLYEAASHYFWAIWAIVQASNSIIDFDYIHFATTRYSLYQSTINIYKN